MTLITNKHPLWPYLLVVHTLAYLRDTFPLGLKGRFYVKLVFVSKEKILCHCCLCVLNGNILRQTSGVKPNAIKYKDPYLRERFYAKYYLVLYIIVPINLVSMATIDAC